jgi:DNA-binding MarR family transcriptional regulator
MWQHCRPMADDGVARVLNHYPRIYFACHTRHVHDPATGRALSAHQASILDHLDEVEAMTLTDLADHMGVTPGTMCVHVERLVKRGYVARLRDPQDGRRRQLRLTRGGPARARGEVGARSRSACGACWTARRGESAADALRGLALLADAADASGRRRTHARASRRRA